MNFFIKQGRCRICGKMFCCFEHQKVHENLEHSEYADWFDILPVMCRRCNRNISTINDLNTRCVQLTKHKFVEGTYAGTPRPNRKRRLPLTLENSESSTETASVPRRKLVPSCNRQRKSLSPGFDLVNVNTDSRLRNVFSPQLNNVSYKILATDVKKNSTPLNDDKENIDSTIEKYTPENKSVNSIILVSAMKKNSTPFEKNLERKVTFEDECYSNGERSIYSTPIASIEGYDGKCCNVVSFVNVSPTVRRNDGDGSEEEKYDCEIVSVVTFSPVVGHESDLDSITVDEEPIECKILTVAKSVQVTLSSIPRSLFNIWDWTQQKFKRKNNYKRTVIINSPPSKRLKLIGNTMLRRRPIFSHWINTSSSSLVRNPLPTYIKKYSDENV